MDLRIEIDPLLCVAFADCVRIAPEAFELNDAGVVVLVEPQNAEQKVGRARLLEACAACPVDALLVWDADGKQLVP
ncbi:MAG: ferredoxin [Gemmatimonadales bacterium]